MSKVDRKNSFISYIKAYSAEITIGGGTPTVVTHNLNLAAAYTCNVMVYRKSTLEAYDTKIEVIDENSLQITKNGANLVVYVFITGN